MKKVVFITVMVVGIIIVMRFSSEGEKQEIITGEVHETRKIAGDSKMKEPYKKGTVKRRKTTKKHQRKELNTDFEYGESYVFRGDEYKVMTNIKAITKNKFSPDFGEVVKEQNGYVFYKAYSYADRPLNKDKLALPVVLNTNNSLMYVMTGNFMVKVREGSNIRHILDDEIDENLVKITYEAKHIRTYYLQLTDGENILGFHDYLKSLNEVVRSEVELIGLPKEPR